MQDNTKRDIEHEPLNDSMQAQQGTTDDTDPEGILCKARRARLGITAVVVAAAICGGLITTGCSSNRYVQVSSAKSKIQQEVSELLSGIPQNGNTLGQPTAPVTLQIFGDLECVDVRTFSLLILPWIIRDFVRSNVLKIQYRSLETDTLHPQVFLIQQAAALAAGRQDKMWNFVEIFYHEQGQEYTNYVTEKYLQDIASQIPRLDLTQWDSNRNEIDLAKKAATDNNTARALGFHDTPSFLIGRTGEKMTKLFGYQIMELTGRRLRHPESLVDVTLLREAIERLV